MNIPSQWLVQCNIDKRSRYKIIIYNKNKISLLLIISSFFIICLNFVENCESVYPDTQKTINDVAKTLLVKVSATLIVEALTLTGLAVMTVMSLDNRLCSPVCSPPVSGGINTLLQCFLDLKWLIQVFGYFFYVVGDQVVFHMMIASVCRSCILVYMKLVLLDPILDLMKVYADCFEHFLFDTFVSNTDCRCIVNLYWGGRLGMIHFDKCCLYWGRGLAV